MLPDEMWTTILEHLNGRDTTCMLLACTLFKQLITNNNRLDNIKYSGFPRVEGKCKLYPFNTNFLSINLVTNFLYDRNDGLVRGDIVYVSEKVYIFDGIKLMEPLLHKYHIYNSYILPKEFAITNDSIPIDYWYRIDEKFRDINRYVWIDSNLIKQHRLSHKNKFNFKYKNYILQNNIDYIYDLNDLDNQVLIYQYMNMGVKEYFIHDYTPVTNEQQSICTIL